MPEQRPAHQMPMEGEQFLPLLPKCFRQLPIKGLQQERLELFFSPVDRSFSSRACSSDDDGAVRSLLCRISVSNWRISCCTLLRTVMAAKVVRSSSLIQTLVLFLLQTNLSHTNSKYHLLSFLGVDLSSMFS
ncbi:MAG: hypothetical protein D3924_16930, partial [Candidatus Electrothrix sp. AR4]|nr:hypothetical protein [Candidatus Electrothrix sp. AR4]